MRSLHHPSTLFVLLVLIQLNFTDSQIRFPDEDTGNSRPLPTGNHRGVSNDYNTNWYSRTNCMSYRYVPGYCLPLNQCGELRYSRDFSVLRRSLCGFYGNDPKVCCPAQSNAGGYPNPNSGNGGYTNPNNGGYTNNGYTGNGYTNPNSGGYTSNGYTTPSTPPPINSDLNNPNVDLTYPRRLPQPCGISSKETTRVVGGSPALPGAWPWMVSLQYGKPGSRNHLCGAALVSQNVVITASHCVKNDDESTTSAGMLSVRLGEHNIEENAPEDAAEEFEIEKVVAHPDYTKEFKNDIAVLKLRGNVRFNQRVSPVCLPYDSEMIRTKSLTGRSAMITGWGATSYGGSSSPTLLQATLKVVNPNFCKSAFQRYLTITDEYLCAASEGFDKDSCQGDSGGPLTMYDPDRRRWYLIGVVSFGKKCASKDMPGVYTRISFPKLLTWLNQFF